MKKNYNILKYVAICVLVLAAGTIGYLLLNPSGDNTTQEVPGSVSEQVADPSVDTPVADKIVVQASNWWMLKNLGWKAIVGVGVIYIVPQDRLPSYLFTKSKLALGAIWILVVGSYFLLLLYPKFKEENLPLLEASLAGDLDKVKRLVEGKGDINNAMDQEKNTAVMLGAKTGHLEVVKYFVEKGADIEAENKDGWNALELSAEAGHLEVVKYLVEERTYVGEENDQLDTALRSSAEEGHLEVVKYLVSKGANVKAEDGNGNTAVHFSAREGHLDVLKYLVTQGADINATNENGDTALHFSAYEGHLEVVKYLVEEVKVDIHATNAQDKKAYSFAKEKNHGNVMGYLTGKGHF